jgi:hypothetical protein
MRQRVMEAFGDVVVVSTDGKRLLTPHLRFDQARNLVRSDSAFTLIEGSRRSEGLGFESDPNATQFVCKRSCTARFTAPIPTQ